MDANFKILALDPGTQKCGLAVLDNQGQIIFRKIILSADLQPQISNLIGQHRPAFLVVGRGTGRQKFLEIFAALNLKVVESDEKFSSQEARGLYWQLHPPGGWRRFLPRGLLLPPEPIDDLAAVIIGRKYLTRL